MNLLDAYFLKMIFEFYASYQVRQDVMQLRGKVGDFSCLSAVRVRGAEVILFQRLSTPYFGMSLLASDFCLRRKLLPKAVNSNGWLSLLFQASLPEL